MRKINNVLAAVAIVATALLTAQCDDDKNYYEGTDVNGKPIANPGAVVIGAGPDVADSIPVTITDLDGDVIDEVQQGDTTDLAEGTYLAMIVTPRDGLTIEGTKIIHKADSAHAETIDHDIKAGCVRFDVNKNHITNVTITLASMTRLLNVDLTLDGVNATNIKNVEVVVQDVATSVDILEGFGHVSTDALRDEDTPYHSCAETDEFEHTMVLPVRMFGIADVDHAALDVNITVAGGEVLSTEIPAGDVLKTFDLGSANAPATIDLEMRLASDKLSGTITDWEMGEEVAGEVNY